MLAVLLLNQGRQTTLDEPVDAVWGEDAPPTAHATLRIAWAPADGHHGLVRHRRIIPGMGKRYDRIDGRIRTFIEEQPVFFAATAPRADDGHVNLSPKGRAGTLIVLDEMTLAYLDFGGSSAETIAHLRENGRITLMWCAFTGPPKVLRVHGRGEPVFRDDPRWPEYIPRFKDVDGPSARAIIVVHAQRVSDSCGFAVPFLDYQEERTQHAEHFGRKSDEEFAAYCERKDHVGVSLDGLPALPLPLPPRTPSA